MELTVDVLQGTLRFSTISLGVSVIYYHKDLCGETYWRYYRKLRTTKGFQVTGQNCIPESFLVDNEEDGWPGRQGSEVQRRSWG